MIIQRNQMPLEIPTASGRAWTTNSYLYGTSAIRIFGIENNFRDTEDKI